MTNDLPTFENKDGLVEFPFTTEPANHSALRLKFRNHIVSLNDKYLKRFKKGRWCPEEYERLFTEFRSLYEFRELSPVENYRTDWKERPDFELWLEQVHTFDPTFSKPLTKRTLQTRHFTSIYQEWEVLDREFAKLHGIYYNRAGYPYTDFCPTSTPIGRRVLRPKYPEFADQEPDTTHYFTRPVPYQWSRADVEPTGRFVKGDDGIRVFTKFHSTKIPSNEEIRITRIEEDRRQRIWDSEKGEFVLPEKYYPDPKDIPVYTCIEGSYPLGLVKHHPPSLKKQTCFRFGQEIVKAKSTADLNFIGWIVENVLIHEVIPAVGDVDPLRGERPILLPRELIIHDRAVPTKYKFRWCFFDRGFAYFDHWKYA